MSRSVLVMTLLMSVILVACVEDSFQREDLQKFLSEYDPVLKTRRDELVSTVGSLNNNIMELRALESSYRHEKAKIYVRRKIEEAKIQRANLIGILQELDARIEVAMANRQIDAVNSGGIESREILGLLNEKDSVIADADEALRDIEALFNTRLDSGDLDMAMSSDGKSGSAPPHPESEEVIEAGGRTIRLGEQFDVMIFPASGAVFHEVVVTDVDTTFIRVRHRDGLAVIGIRDLAGMRLGSGSGGGVDPGVKSGEVRSETGWAVLYASPSADDRAVKRVFTGERLLIAPPGSPAGWRQVLTRDGARGWMPESSLSI